MGSPLSSTNYSPPLPNTPGLQHELHRLGDGHEVATHLGVGDGNRPAGLGGGAEDGIGVEAIEDLREAHSPICLVLHSGDGLQVRMGYCEGGREPACASMVSLLRKRYMPLVTPCHCSGPIRAIQPAKRVFWYWGYLTNGASWL